MTNPLAGRIARKIQRTLAGVTLLPKPKRLLFGPLRGIKSKTIPVSDPVYKELARVLERCRSFPYDLEVFQKLEPETRYLSAMAAADKISLDVGANLGFYSALLSPLSSRVIAFEANPYLQPYLAINLQRFMNICVLPLAAAQAAGEAVFNIPYADGEDALGCFGMGGMRDEFINKMGFKSRPVSVPMLPIDALGLERVGFMKIDVEGSEFAVLQGAAATVDRWRPGIIVENEYRHNTECRNVFEFLVSRDYQGYFVDRATLALKPFDMFSLEKDQIALLDAQHNITDTSRYIFNFMFVPREADRLKPLVTFP